MTGLEAWLRQATRQLSKDSVAQVRAEIREHYEASREAAASSGATVDEADRTAVAALGDARTANCQYRNVLLTAAEARILRESNWEVQAICSRPWLNRLLVVLCVATLWAGAALLLAGSVTAARLLLAGGIGFGFLFVAPLLPIYTLSRSRVYRGLKLAIMTAMVVLAFGPNALKWFWLLVSCLWPLFWVEWTRASIRRKLPAAQWPRQLYL